MAASFIDKRISPHFFLSEFLVTQHRELNNTPPPELMDNCYFLADRMEIIRSALNNAPITATSVYRSPAVNRAVGGSIDSDHMKFLACDFICPSFGTPLEICRFIDTMGCRELFRFDQLIYEFTWVHIGFKRTIPMRQQVMTVQQTAGQRPTYINGLPK